jgi:hypothetical protein
MTELSEGQKVLATAIDLALASIPTDERTGERIVLHLDRPIGREGIELVAQEQAKLAFDRSLHAAVWADERLH